MKSLPDHLFDDPGMDQSVYPYRLPHLSESVWSHLTKMLRGVDASSHEFCL